MITASAPTTRLSENPYNSRVKPPSTAGYWASIPGCAGLDWGRLALASPDNIGLCRKNLVQLYVECGASSRTVETLGTGETKSVRIPVCNHRLDGSETAFHLLFLAQWTKRVNIDVQAGKTYYVEWTADNIVYRTKSFDLVDEATGAAAVPSTSLPKSAEMRAASLLTVSAFLLLTAAVVHAAKWQWPPVPAAEAIKNADFGREPTVEEVESQITRFGVKNSGRGRSSSPVFRFCPPEFPEGRPYTYRARDQAERISSAGPKHCFRMLSLGLAQWSVPR